MGFASETEALQYVRDHSNTVDVLVVLQGLGTLPPLLEPPSSLRYVLLCVVVVVGGGGVWNVKSMHCSMLPKKESTGSMVSLEHSSV